MASLALGVKFVPASNGTGDFVASSTVTGFRAASNLVDGKTYRYRAENSALTEWEFGTGVWTSSTSTLTRTVSFSSTGSKINFTVAPQVGIIQFVDDVLQFDDAMTLTNAQKNRAQTNIGVREVLLSSRTYYVRKDGNDTNTGLVNSSAGAFLTITKAINTVSGLDLNGQSCIIQVGAGTYTETVTANVPFVGGVPILTGDTTTPSNVVINASSICIFVLNGTELSVQGFRILSTGDGLLAQNAGRLNVIGNMEYGACTVAHMHAKYAGLITVTANYSVTGGAAWHWWAETAGGSIQVIGRTITITGTPNFSGAWAGCTIVAQIVPVSNTYSGSATGARYVVQLNGVIYSSGATLPGNSAGTALTGGQYN